MKKMIVMLLLLITGITASLNAATNQYPAAGATNIDPDSVVLTWVKPVTTNAYRTKVYLGPYSSSRLSSDYCMSYTTPYTNTFAVPAVLEPNTVYEWRVDDCNDANGAVLTNGYQGFGWDGKGVETSFTTGPGDLRRAHSPVPARGSTVTSAVDNVLQWSAGSGAAAGVSYNVYFGKDSTPDETEFRGNLTNRSFSAGILVPGTRYHWRIDTVDTNGTSVVTGSVWNLTAGLDPVNYTDTNTLIYADDFENGTLNQCPSGWTRQGPPQLRAVSGRGKVVKISGTSWIEKQVDVWNMKDVRISYRCSLTGYTNYGGYLRCQISTDGTNWTNLRSMQTGSFSNNPSVVTCGTAADNQPGLRIRFASDSTNTAAYTYLDSVTISGVYAPALPAHDPDSPAIEGATVIFLGDSLTSNSGSNEDHWTGQLTQLFDLDVLSAFAGVDTNGVPKTRVFTHGKGGSRAYCGIGYSNTTPYAVTNSVIYHGSAASAWDLGGYQRLKYAFEEAALQTNGMVIPDYVIINFGMNDHKRDWRNGINTEMSTPADFTNHLAMIIDLVRTNGSRPVLVVPHDFYPGSTNSFESYNHDYSPELYNYASDNYSALGRFHLFMDGMRTLAQNMGVDLVDLNKAASEYDGREFTINGGVHLDELGHNVYAEIVGAYLDARH